MACGIPVVASPVGINKELVLSGKRGFLARNEKEWVSSLSKLIVDFNLRKRMGKEGREFVKKYYSARIIGQKLVKIFRDFKKYEKGQELS